MPNLKDFLIRVTELDPWRLRPSGKPWFRKQAAGMGWVPATPQGYAVLGLFIVFVLATAWLPPDFRPPILIGLGASYLALSFWLSLSR